MLALPYLTSTTPRHRRAPILGGPGFNTYDAPKGFIIGGTTSVTNTTAIVLPLSFPNFSEVSYYNETEINTITPLTSPPPNPYFPPPGSPSGTLHHPTDQYHPARCDQPELRDRPRGSQRDQCDSRGTGRTPTTTTITLSLPSKSTVLGGVISNPHTAEPNDFAGIFADDTSGVFVGILPKS